MKAAFNGPADETGSALRAETMALASNAADQAEMRQAMADMGTLWLTPEERQLDVLAGVPDPGERARRAGALIDNYQSVIAELSRLRREAIDEMIARGMTQTQIAEAIGITRARVGQLLKSG